MNKLLALCGLVMLSATTTSQEVNDTPQIKERVVVTSIEATEECNPVIYAINTSMNEVSFEWNSNMESETPVAVNLDDIIYIEEETDLELGFDTAEYLPDNFDPHKQYVDLDAIAFIEDDNSFELGFSTEEYLPEGFNAYADATDFRNIDYIEEGEDDFDLGFDTAEYLPEGFDPHDVYVDLDAIEYIEDDVIDFDYLIGYSTKIYDPYTK